MTTTEKQITPIHQWTHDGNKVLLVKCVNANGTSREGFQWPKSGLVKPATWAPDQSCNSGGLFGWAWGLNIGGGKDPVYRDAAWIVFAADPANVVHISDGSNSKEKVGPEAEVVYFGDWAGALEFTCRGRE